MAEQDAALRELQPWKAAFEGDLGWFADLSGHLPEILKGVAAAHAGITPDAFDEAARRFLDAARHPRFGVPYHRLTYRPMPELLDLLRARGFKVFVASAGGRDFIRAVSEEIYRVGLPPVLAAGNADGDIQMLELPGSGSCSTTKTPSASTPTKPAPRRRWRPQRPPVGSW